MADYQNSRAGKWHLMVLAGWWNGELEKRIFSVIERQPASKHPQTFELTSLGSDQHPALYLKIFYPPTGMTTVRNLLRKSKAARFLDQSLALSKAGFHAPVTIAVGETGKWTLARRAFVLTVGVGGQSLVSYLHDCWFGRKPRPTLAEKRKALTSLGRLIRSFHDCGFVHGDLVPSNLFVLNRAGGDSGFCFMDNDRTRHYPRWLPQSLWKRNLIQLNRFPLPGISLQDRLRFFRGYTGRAIHGARERSLLRWLEQRTRRRRREVDRVCTTGSFRMLMRWTPESPRLEEIAGGYGRHKE